MDFSNGGPPPESGDEQSLQPMGGSDGFSSDTSLDATASGSVRRAVRGRMSSSAITGRQEEVPPSYNSAAFILAARGILERGNRRVPAGRSSYVQVFGVSPNISAMVWMYVRDSVPVDTMPKHLLWALLLMKTYATEGVNECLAGVHRETFRRWSWLLIEAMSDMPTVRTTVTACV